MRVSPLLFLTIIIIIIISDIPDPAESIIICRVFNHLFLPNLLKATPGFAPLAFFNATHKLSGRKFHCGLIRQDLVSQEGRNPRAN